MDKVSPIKLFDENKTLCGFNLRRLMYQQGRTAYVHEVVQKVFDLYKDGKIKPVVDSTWALEDVSETTTENSIIHIDHCIMQIKINNWI